MRLGHLATAILSQGNNVDVEDQSRGQIDFKFHQLIEAFWGVINVSELFRNLSISEQLPHLSSHD